MKRPLVIPGSLDEKTGAAQTYPAPVRVIRSPTPRTARAAEPPATPAR